MQLSLRRILSTIALGLSLAPSAYAWGRHDLITRLVVDSPELSALKVSPVLPEPIEQAAPDLMKRVIPGVERWCERYHREHDDRYAWTTPMTETMAMARGRKLSDREALLWALEDNIDTPLVAGPERDAAEILVRYVEEPDNELDAHLDQSPYIERVRESMGYFYDKDNPHTHTFRHMYVPSSMIPPIWRPQGLAPYRAGLYARLAEGAFATGHAYWGYRFLAWSIHYLQDSTQPWHSVFVPSLRFLSFSKAKMKHDISALHFLTEAFADTWLLRKTGEGVTTSHPVQLATLMKPMRGPASDAEDRPWAVSELAEGNSRHAHEKASLVANAGRELFMPVVDRLGEDLKPVAATIPLGGMQLASAKLDFDGNGSGATEFLAPIWNADFGLRRERDSLLRELEAQLRSAVESSRTVIELVTRGAALPTLAPSRGRF